MEQKTLSVELRNERKSGAARRMRNEGLIPAVIYGHGDPQSIKVNEKEFGLKFPVISESEIVTLVVDGQEKDVLVKEYQYDILSDRVKHIDFFEIEAGKTLRTHITVQFTGTAAGIKDGGIMESHLHEVEVECLPRNIPESIEYNIDSLEIGGSVHVKDLVAPEGVKILTDGEATLLVIAHLKSVTETVTDDEEEAVE